MSNYRADRRPVADGTISRAQSRVATSPNKLKLGVFGINVAGGAGGISTLLGQTEVDSWEEQRKLAVMADRGGFEVLVPVSRWKGFGGPSGHWDRSYETWTWGAALAAVTERIQIFTTCAVPLYHPVMAAKLAATLDHISGGRWGLNIVPGWLGSEFKMFGMELGDRGARYKFAQEWITLVDRLWTETEEFDFDGDYFHLEGAISTPKPMQTRPMIMNAGQSAEGQKFAVDNADMIYIKLSDTDECRNNIASIRAQAEAQGKQVSVWGNLDLICKPTEKEARAFADDWLAAGDEVSVAGFVAAVMGGDSASQDRLRNNPQISRIISLTGGGESVIGSPEQVVDALQRYSDLGMDGLALTFHEYPEALEYFISDVHPLLIEAGLRSEKPLDS
jgi:alkanesulfonate monooxygenase SsuD/methylene tetrahydromethanopterin reductase-like flavin-dependent oxidoreductase (luciferase family)